jgi:hypothetical protein
MNVRRFLIPVFLLFGATAAKAQIAEVVKVQRAITEIIADAPYGFSSFVAGYEKGGSEFAATRTIPGTIENSVRVTENGTRSQYVLIAARGLNDEMSRKLAADWRDLFLDSLSFSGGELVWRSEESEEIHVSNSDANPVRAVIGREKESAGWTVRLTMDTKDGTAMQPNTTAKDKAMADSLLARRSIDIYAGSIRKLLSDRLNGFENYRGRDVSGEEENQELYESNAVQFPADSAAKELIRIKRDTLVSYHVALKGAAAVKDLVAAFRESGSDPALKGAGYKMAEIAPGISWRITLKGEEVASLVIKNGKATMVVKAVLKETADEEEPAGEE